LQFNAVLAAVKNNKVDAAISTITITEDRKKKFDFSTPYYKENMAVIFVKNSNLYNQFKLNHKKIACQLGTTMEIWLKKQIHNNIKVLVMDNNPQAVEMLKSGHVDGVLIDAVQASVFTKKNPGLSYNIIGESDNAYGVAFKKGSALKKQVNKALKKLEENGEIEKLKNKYLKIQ
jgi:polar amino acid transport system substrate-binding protein